MAKQNVSFGERHLEKFVIAVAGIVLAAMLFLFVIQDPYSIEVSGETLGPGAFYPQLEEKATQALNAIKNAQAPQIPEVKLPALPNQRTATDLPVVFAPINPPIPKLDGGIEVGGKVDLVSILPPGKPALTSGRAQAAVPDAKIRMIGEAAATPETSPGDPVDHHWINVFATVPRKAQQEAFIKAKYAVERQLLIVTKVEAERQRLLPSGEWSAPEKVAKPYSPVVFSADEKLTIGSEGGKPTVSPDEMDAVKKFREETRLAQKDILRPPFQPLLSGDSQLSWTVPAAMPDGTKFNWADFGVVLPLEGGTDAQPGPGGPARLDYRKAKAEIDGLIAAGKYMEAEIKIQEILKNNQNLPPNQKKELDALVVQLQPKIKEQSDRDAAEKLRREAAEASTLGADVDLLWLTDLSVTSGEMYRYRVRLVALNNHAGLLGKLNKPEQGTDVVLAGEWSEWSDPVEVKPAKYLFCTGVDPQGVKLELNQWVNGEWDKTNQVVNLGQPLSFQDKLKEFAYDAVPVALSTVPRFEERIADKRGIRYREPRESTAVVFVRTDGEVEEHVVLGDVSQRRELANEFAPKREAAQSRQPATPGRTPEGRPSRATGRRDEP